MRVGPWPLLVACAAVAMAQTVSENTRAEMEKFVDCPAKGEYRNGKLANGSIAALNVMKNRYRSPESFDRSITLEQMSMPGDDSRRWTTQKDLGARVSGYVAFMIQNFEGESCNCFKIDDAHSDTHIDLVVSEKTANDFATHVIVEVTPRMKFLAKKRGLNWSTASLMKQFNHKWVTVEGWLMWDGEHIKQASNTHPADPDHNNWRVTCWEIHPVTRIELASRSER